MLLLGPFLSVVVGERRRTNRERKEGKEQRRGEEREWKGPASMYVYTSFWICFDRYLLRSHIYGFIVFDDI
jgi:hypothetical protein